MKTTCPHCRSAAAVYAIKKITPTNASAMLQCADIQACGARTLWQYSLKKSIRTSSLKPNDYQAHADGLVSANARINCPCCGESAVIYSRYNPTAITSDLYCECQNEGCKARVIVDYAYEATILPPVTGIEQIARYILKNAPEKKAQQGQGDLFGLVT